jgi:Abnormal spindle-like microcephaly-assoc'd, ASPM-SPD-2-Hydin
MNTASHSSNAFRTVLKLLLGIVASAGLASAQAVPEITVEEPVGTDLLDGISGINYGNVILGASSLKTFIIKNTGTANLLNLAVTKTGTASTQFTVVTTTMATTLAPGADTRFTVSFGPTGTTSGLRTAEIRIASNDANENPFNIAVSGSGVIPEIAVEQPAGTNLVDGTASLSYGNVATATTNSRVFTIKNLGSGDLTGLTITKDGTGNSQFIVNTTGMLTTLPPAASTTFTVDFMPTGPSGSRAAFVRITSNDANENPFDIALTGTAYSTTIDTDGDGLHDWGEFQLSGLGFNWQTSQPTLVSALQNGAPAAGLFSTDQIQSLKVATSLTQDDLAPQPFKLSVSIEKATSGSNYSPVPLNSVDTTINSAGNLELRFNAAEPGALFKVQTQ